MLKVGESTQNRRKRVVWYWKSNKDPWSMNDKEEWTPYSDIECEIIEEAFQKGAKNVELDSYIINIKEEIQSLKIDSYKKRPIKRVEINRQEMSLRQERFVVPSGPATLARPDGTVFPPLVQKSKFCEDYIHGCPGDYVHFSDMVKYAAQGILKEGTLLGKKAEARWIANQLISVANSKPSEIAATCASLYTKECFLYKIVNKALREDDMSKADTLGPFCYLLNEFILSHTDKKYGTDEYTLFRGANLTESEIKKYEEVAKAEGLDGLFAWNSFTSTSKSRSKAEQFGNTLFLLRETFEYGGILGAELAHLSDFPDEEEVILHASHQYVVDKVEKKDGKCLIYLSMRNMGY